jgi:hypothetical protein
MGLYSSKVYIGEGGGGDYVREVYGITKTCRCFLNFHLKKLVMFSSQNIRECEYILNDVKLALIMGIPECFDTKTWHVFFRPES